MSDSVDKFVLELSYDEAAMLSHVYNYGLTASYRDNGYRLTPIQMLAMVSNAREFANNSTLVNSLTAKLGRALERYEAEHKP